MADHLSPKKKDHARDEINPGPTIALRDFQRAPRAGKLSAHYPNGPFWKTQLPTVLPHSSRWMSGPFHLHRGLGAIHSNQIEETIVPASLVTSWQNECTSYPLDKSLRSNIELL